MIPLNRIRATFFLLSYFFVVSVSAQELKTIRVENYAYAEEYHVLKSDKKIKEGAYHRETMTSPIVIDGNFKDNKMEGKWMQSWNGLPWLEANYSAGKRHGSWRTFSRLENGDSFLRDSGTYTNGKRTGNWMHRETRNLLYVADYDNWQITRCQLNDSSFYRIMKGGDTLNVRLENPPLNPEFAVEFLLTSTPKLQRIRNRQKIDRKATVAFYVSELGMMENQEIVGSSGDPELDKYLLRALSTRNIHRWFPATYAGVSVKARMLIPVEFRMPLKKAAASTVTTQPAQIAKGIVSPVTAALPPRLTVSLKPAVEIIF